MTNQPKPDAGKVSAVGMISAERYRVEAESRRAEGAAKPDAAPAQSYTDEAMELAQMLPTPILRTTQWLKDVADILSSYLRERAVPAQGLDQGLCGRWTSDGPCAYGVYHEGPCGRPAQGRGQDGHKMVRDNILKIKGRVITACGFCERHDELSAFKDVIECNDCEWSVIPL